MRSHKAKTVKIAAAVMHKDLQISAEVYDELMPMFRDSGEFPPKALQVLAKLGRVGNFKEGARFEDALHHGVPAEIG